MLTENWINVPTNSIVTIDDQITSIEDIQDQFYNTDPWHRRSAKYVRSKGLVANEKTSTPTALPSPGMIVPEDNLQLEKKAHLGPTIPFSLMRSATPQMSRTTTPDIFTHNATTQPRGRATISGGSPNNSNGNSKPTSTDVRIVTNSEDVTKSAAPPLQNAPSQGNIKKKRMSLSDLPQASAQSDPPTPLSPIERTAYGDPAKIARFFPELTLSPP